MAKLGQVEWSYSIPYSNSGSAHLGKIQIYSSMAHIKKQDGSEFGKDHSSLHLANQKHSMVFPGVLKSNFLQKTEKLSFLTPEELFFELDR